MADFTIEGRMKNLPDIQKTWMWQLWIPTIADLLDGYDQKDILLRARTAVIPGRGNEVMTSEFMGMKQFFPGKPTFTNTMSVTLEETEDQLVTKLLYEWRQQIFNIEPGINGGGANPTKVTKRQLTRDIVLRMFKYNKDPLKKQIKFVNAWPTNVEDVTLAYSGAEQVIYNVTFQYDFWEMITGD